MVSRILQLAVGIRSQIFQGITFLSTTKDNRLTKLTSQEDTYQVEHATSQKLTADITGATIDVLHICPLKHKIADMTLSKVHCEKCNTFYKSSCITHYTRHTNNQNTNLLNL